MRQIGNLAIRCAQRSDVLCQIQAGKITVHAGQGPQRTTMTVAWDDDTAISKIMHELNYGQFMLPGGEPNENHS